MPRRRARHIDYAFFLGPGRHDRAFWTGRLPESLKFRSRHTRRAGPASTGVNFRSRPLAAPGRPC